MKQANKSKGLFLVLTIVLASMSLINPAYAGLTVGVTMMATVITWLTTLSIAVCTVAFMFIGYRMMFAAAQWKDVAPIFWGAIIIGAAGSIAAVVAA